MSKTFIRNNKKSRSFCAHQLNACDNNYLFLVMKIVHKLKNVALLLWMIFKITLIHIPKCHMTVEQMRSDACVEFKDRMQPN